MSPLVVAQTQPVNVKSKKVIKRQVKKKIDWKELIGWSGSLRFAGFQKDNSFIERQGYLASSLWMNLRPKEFYGINTYIDGYVQGQNLNRDRYSTGDLREFYFDRSISIVDIRLGRQITSWGRADKVNPTDVWSTKNMNLLTVDDEDQKTGLFATQISINLSNTKFIMLSQPEWRWPIFPITPLPDGVTLVNVLPEKIKNQYGLKIDYSGGSFDGSLSYSHVLDKTPDLTILSMDSGIQMGFLYQMIDVYGFDFAKNFGKTGFRTECSYTKTGDLFGDDIFTKNNNLFCATGLDRSFGDLYLNLQYVYRHVFNYLDTDLLTDVNQQTIAAQENVISNQFGKDNKGASLRLGYKAFNEKLDLDFTVFGWFKYSDYIFRPKITYAFTDSFKVLLGGEMYSGPSTSYFGRFKNLSRSYLEMRYLF